MVDAKTRDWYCSIGWVLINDWLTRFSAKQYSSAYGCNWEAIPDWIDAESLVKIFNADSQSWSLSTDPEGDLLFTKILYLGVNKNGK